MNSQLAYSVEVRSPLPHAVGAESVTDALRAERRQLDELVAIMRRQRAAVAADDLQGTNDSVFATHRVLLTLGEARRRRQTINRLLGGREDIGIRGLEEAMEDRMTDDLHDAFRALHETALTLARELEINRRVLREALASSDEYVRTLTGAADQPFLYVSGDGGSTAEKRQGGVLINRKA